jgi:hypothetical protein
MNRWDRFSRVAALKPVNVRGSAGSIKQVAEASTGASADELCALVGGEIARNVYGEHVAVRRWFAEPESFAPNLDALRLLLPVDAPENVRNAAGDPANWLFLDTETTGLAGGTGTYAFLVGVAWWDAGGLQVEQQFMRDFGEEHALLQSLADRLAKRRVLVTFNGKSFDWPLLETRFRMTRAIQPCSPRAHLDLLHPARQLWRLRLPSLRLTELERHIVGWDRGPDLWSAMIPQLYFDFLRGAPAAPLADVFRHNQQDLRGLAAVAARMLRMLAEPELASADALELCGLSRLFRRRGEIRRARQLYERALAAGLPSKLDHAARRELARLAKRDRDFSRANELWGELAAENEIRDSDTALEACEQLAIYYEHHARQPQRAAELTRNALAALAKAHRDGKLTHAQHRKLRVRLAHRLARLESKSETSTPRFL